MQVRQFILTFCAEITDTWCLESHTPVSIFAAFFCAELLHTVSYSRTVCRLFSHVSWEGERHGRFALRALPGRVIFVALLGLLYMHTYRKGSSER